MSDGNYRQQVDAFDYLSQKQKRDTMQGRRPSIRRASDLVGPGIGASAVRVTDWNDLLPSYNGYYSSLPGALNAPNAIENFVGHTYMDDAIGGRQVVTGMASGTTYSRTFLRNPSDASSVSYGAWKFTETIPASAMSSSTTPTPVATGPTLVNLTMPGITTIGLAGTYSRTATALTITRTGVYTGFFRIAAPSGITAQSLVYQWPKFTGLDQTTLSPATFTNATMFVHFTFWTTSTSTPIVVAVSQTTGSSQTFTLSDLSITRIGDAA